jgi:cell division protein FtsW (lipid II flippase)
MLLRPPFMFTAVVIFSILNGWAFVNGLNQNNVWSCLMSSAAICGTFYFVHIYQKLRTTPVDDNENNGIDDSAI